MFVSSFTAVVSSSEFSATSMSSHWKRNAASIVDPRRSWGRAYSPAAGAHLGYELTQMTVHRAHTKEVTCHPRWTALTMILAATATVAPGTPLILERH